MILSAFPLTCHGITRYWMAAIAIIAFSVFSAQAQDTNRYLPPAVPAVQPVGLIGEGGVAWRLFMRDLNLQINPDSAVHAPTHILVLGDSHTAGDGMTQALRYTLQNRFGDGGIGWLQPGKVRYYRSNQASIEQSPGWNTYNSLGDRDADGDYGLGGFINRTRRANETVRYTLLPRAHAVIANAAPVAEIFYHGAPPLISADGEPVPAVGASVDSGVWTSNRYPLGHWPQHLDVLSGGSATLAGVSIETGLPGVVVDTVGIASARMDLIKRWNIDALRQQFAARDYRLIVVEYGTNDAYNSSYESAKFESITRDMLTQLADLAPNAAVILMAPPDAQTRSATCMAPPPKGRHRRPPPTPIGCNTTEHWNQRSCTWLLQPNLEPVRRVLKAVALEQRQLYWDWSQVMHGTCGTHMWTLKDPPQALPDHVHMSTIGYTMTGNALADAILERYRQMFPQ